MADQPRGFERKISRVMKLKKKIDATQAFLRRQVEQTRVIEPDPIEREMLGELREMSYRLQRRLDLLALEYERKTKYANPEPRILSPGVEL